MHDLPAWPHWTSDHSYSASEITQKILAGLKKHNITGVYNFANSGTGMVDNDDATILKYDPTYRQQIEDWIAAGHYIGNHTHSHIATFETTIEDLKEDIKRCDIEFETYIALAPQKLMCLCYDCQGDTTEIAVDLRDYLASFGYKHCPAASMIFEWRWEKAWLHAKATKNDELLEEIRTKFLDFSVRQTVLDCKRGQLMFDDFIPSLLLHMLNIVADNIDEWLARVIAAGCVFVSTEECMTTRFWDELEGLADPLHDPRASVVKMAEHKGVTLPWHTEKDAATMEWIDKLGDEAAAAGSVVNTRHIEHRAPEGYVDPF